MNKKQPYNDNQLTLNFNSLNTNDTKNHQLGSSNIFCINQAAKFKTDQQKKEILDKFNNYASKLNW